MESSAAERVEAVPGSHPQRIGRASLPTQRTLLTWLFVGRLILADALIAASKEKPAAILDLATLTGAALVALGNRVAGVLGNNESWIEQVRAAGAATGEPIWQLPLYDAYTRDLESKVADVKQCTMAGEAGYVVVLEICGFNNWLLKLLGLKV